MPELPNLKKKGEEEADNPETRMWRMRLRRPIIVMMAGGMGCIIFFSFSASNICDAFSVAFTGLVIAGASLLAGGMLGFLFGIPRTLQNRKREEVTENKVEAEATPEKLALDSLATNTNLEDISDWLSKILIGAGLTQIKEIHGVFTEVAAAVAVGLGSSQAFGYALVVGFIICGFFYGYLWARFEMANAILKTELDKMFALHGRIRSAGQELTQKIKKSQQESVNVRAVLLVQDFLKEDDELDEQRPSEEDVRDVISEAGTTALSSVFHLARGTRQRIWRDREKQPLMLRTAVIFKALIAQDKDNRFPRNHAQLAYVLKDKEPPDFVTAEKELSIAIDIRGPWKQFGWPFFELNRAMCRIELDPQFKAGKTSPENVREAITEDLIAAYSSEPSRKIAERNRIITEWRRINNVTVN